MSDLFEWRAGGGGDADAVSGQAVRLVWNGGQDDIMVGGRVGLGAFSEIWGEIVCMIGAWGDEACVVYMYVDKERARLRRQSCFPLN